VQKLKGQAAKLRGLHKETHEGCKNHATTMMYPQIMAGWWYTYPSEKYEFVSWDDEIPN
jgi:hypothetical protein